jgi:hypothetical protein
MLPRRGSIRPVQKIAHPVELGHDLHLRVVPDSEVLREERCQVALRGLALR